MCFYILKFKFGFFDGGLEAVPNLTSQWWFDISPEGFGSIAMLVNFIVAIGVHWIVKKPAPEEIQQLVETIRIPSGVNKPSNH
jgi:cation/acetate symporter